MCTKSIRRTLSHTTVRFLQDSINKKNSNYSSRHSNYCCDRSFVVTAYKPLSQNTVLYPERTPTVLNFSELSASFHLHSLEKQLILCTHVQSLWVGQPLKDSPRVIVTSATNGKVHTLDCRAGYSGTEFNNKVYSSQNSCQPLRLYFDCHHRY